MFLIKKFIPSNNNISIEPPLGPLNNVPMEILSEILAYLNTQELPIAGLVCKQFRKLSTQEFIKRIKLPFSYTIPIQFKQAFCIRLMKENFELYLASAIQKECLQVCSVALEGYFHKKTGSMCFTPEPPNQDPHWKLMVIVLGMNSIWSTTYTKLKKKNSSGNVGIIEIEGHKKHLPKVEKKAKRFLKAFEEVLTKTISQQNLSGASLRPSKIEYPRLMDNLCNYSFT